MLLRQVEIDMAQTDKNERKITEADSEAQIAVNVGT
jgi:hypothetical protein